jgi:hypothetical protein
MVMTLGTTSRGRPLRLTDEERSRHVHVVGASGTGKSKFLESMIRQDLLSGRGLCLIDPHGTLAKAVVGWAASLNLHRHRRIHLIDPKDDDWSTGFNPLAYNNPVDLTARVDAMVGTCAEVWGGENINQTPLLTTCLQLVFYALAVNQLTLVEAVELTASSDPHAIRARLTEQLPDHVYEAYWRDFSNLPRREFEERFSSTRRRLLRFLGAPTIRRIVGQRQHALNFQQIMDDGDVVIVDLSTQGSLSDENARLLGAMITSELRLAAMSRDTTTTPKPFSLYIDECYDYLTGDVERMLDQTRKFGLHVILAHQRLGQLKSRSEAIYNGVMAGGQTKIVFGGMSDDDAEVMAKEVYRSSFNLERPKHILDKPVVVDEIPYWLESESWTNLESSAQGGSATSSWGTSTGTSSGLATSYGPINTTDPLGTVATEGESSVFTSGDASSSSWSSSRGTSETRGRSQTLKPVRVTMPMAVYSLDEELHLAIVKLRELPNQAAIVKRRGRPPVRFRPETVKGPLTWPEKTTSFIERARADSPYITTSVHAETEISGRLAVLQDRKAGRAVHAHEEETFWSE